MAFPFFPESHPAMSVENYAYMRRLYQTQQPHQIQPQLQQDQQSTSRPQSSSSTSDRSSPRSSGPPLLTRRRLARIFIPAKLRRTKSNEGPVTDQPPDASSDIKDNSLLSRCTNDDRHTAPTSDPGISSPTTHEFDPASRIFRSCAQLLTNPFSRGFELNPLLLNVAHPLLSGRYPTNQRCRVLDLGGNVDSVYFNAVAGLLGVAVSQFTQTQWESRISPSSLPFAPNSFDVVSARTLYKYSSHLRRLPPDRSRSPVLSLEACVREIHRVLVKGGSFEYIIFDRRLVNVGPLTRELEPFLYEHEHSSSTGICMEGQGQNNAHAHPHSSTANQGATICCLGTPSGSTTHYFVTGTQFLRLLGSEGFTIEKNTTLMFPLDILSTVFTQDGQRRRSDQGGSYQANSPDVTPLLAALMRMVYDECKEYQTAWKCIVGSARKI
ncbi:hypothetical protein BJY00DRAFT_318246 [Aspergillus carlsbadensis]|nr:hypothetical protein BJY00DRAFT_318246 [Aspergillus carlsbadensis]